jgi:hypothetical protein
MRVIVDDALFDGYYEDKSLKNFPLERFEVSCVQRCNSGSNLEREVFILREEVIKKFSKFHPKCHFFKERELIEASYRKKILFQNFFDKR